MLLCLKQAPPDRPWRHSLFNSVDAGSERHSLSAHQAAEPHYKGTWIKEGTCRAEKQSRRGHVGFVDIKVGVNLLHVVVIFHGLHQAQHRLGAAAFQFDVGLRDH
jgi:hypothetical protein